MCEKGGRAMNKICIRILTLLLLIMITGTQLFGQPSFVIIKGQVVSEENSGPISNASIIVEGIRRSFVTDEEGRFLLELPDAKDFIITVNKLGYESVQIQVDANRKTDLQIRMAVADNLLQEVTINTGYQSIPKERATGSFEVVNTELFNRQITTDVISRLDGVLPSVLFDKRGGSETAMIVRGVASLGLTDMRPLIVLDNFPFEGDINSINPIDVERVTLLKDAAAASIWGAKAGNGVLVITTKKGKYGTPWHLNFSVNTTMTEKPNLYYHPQMSSSDFIDVEQFLYEKGVYNSMLNSSTNRVPVTPVISLLYQHSQGKLGDAELQRQMDVFWSQDLRKDLKDYFYRIGLNQQYALSLNGGSDRSSTLFSMGYDNNSRTSVGNDFSRINLNLQNSFQPLNKLELNLGLRYSLLQTSSNHPGNMQMISGRDLYPYARLVDEQGKALVVEKDYRSSYLDGLEGLPLLDWRYRPYDELFLADNTSQANNMLFSINAKYNFLQSLSAELHYQYEYQPSTSRNHYSDQTFYTRNLINRFTKIDGEDVIRPVPLGGIIDRQTLDLKAHSARGQLNYNHDWNRMHQVSIIGGMEVRNSETNRNSTRQYGYDDDLLISNVVNYVDRFPIFDNLASASTISYSSSESAILQRFVSFYANGSYSYDERYTLSISARRDASNLFGLETNKKWKPLWSIGGLWNIAKEPFYHLHSISLLKIRGTYGYSGNVAPDIAAVTTLEYRGLSRTGRFPYAIVNNPPNPSLRWEKISTLNLGLDFGLKSNRIFGSIEYYQKKATDIINSVTADPTTGFNSLARNSAIVRNAGWDLSLNSQAHIGQLSWSGNLLLSINKNKVVQYLRDPTRISSWVGSGSTISPIVGQPAYPLVSYRWAGLDPETGNPIGWLNGKETVDYVLQQQQATKEDLVFHGSALPEYFGSLRNTFEWRGFSVSANISYRAGYYFRRETINYSTLLSASNQVGHADYKLRWQQSGDELKTTVPSLVYPTDSRRNDFYRNSEVTAERGDHIRLQDVSASYTFGRGQKAMFFRDIKTSLYVRNLGILWRANSFKLDPDVRQMPIPKTLSLGLTANF